MVEAKEDGHVNLDGAASANNGWYNNLLQNAVVS
ncbi:hypothetical protein BVRB_2g025020 [Beta vulgaris subsp. vulgaris]|nr:hypothetical protein BVRB_2g025020 [Beta vulgaris subsp. vulgaris]